MTQFEKDKAVALAAATYEANLTTYQSFLERHPEIRDCQANTKAFQEYLSWEEGFTEDDLEFALSNQMPGRLVIVKVPTPAEVIAAENKYRKKLGVPELREICRIENPVPTRGGLPDSWYGADISTPQALRQLAKNNLASFKALVTRFGNEVNKRLGVTPALPVGHSLKLKVQGELQ
jgi:hypothetical protein